MSEKIRGNNFSYAAQQIKCKNETNMMRKNFVKPMNTAFFYRHCKIIAKIRENEDFIFTNFYHLNEVIYVLSPILPDLMTRRMRNDEFSEQQNFFMITI